MRGLRAEATERTPKAEVWRSPHGAQDSKRKEFLLQQESRGRGLDLFGYFLGQAKNVTPGEGADSPFKNKHVSGIKIFFSEKSPYAQAVRMTPILKKADLFSEKSTDA